MPNIAFRADGGKTIGLGHLMRCLSLAEAFRRNGHKVYFFSKLDEGIEKIKLENFEVVRLSSSKQETEGYSYGNPAHLADEAKEMNLLLQEYQIDILIIDNYNVDKEYFAALKPNVRELIYIDDVNKFPYPVDIVVNGNITGEYLGYQKRDENQALLLGPRYNMIRSEFRNMPCRFVRNKVYEIMITTGGSDPYNLTGVLLEILLKEKEFRHTRFNVLVGNGFTKCKYLDSLRRNYDNLYLYANSELSFNLSDIIRTEVSQIMLRSDLAISAGGSTLYELAACGTPALAVILADNQEGIVRKMDEQGYAMSLGWYDQLNRDLVLDRMRELTDDFQRRKAMSAKGQRLVDGQGTERIVRSILQNFDNR